MPKIRKSFAKRLTVLNLLASQGWKYKYSGVGRPRKAMEPVTLADLGPFRRNPGPRRGSNTTPANLRIFAELIPLERTSLEYHKWRNERGQRDSNRTAIRFILTRGGRRRGCDEHQVKTISNRLAEIEKKRSR